MMKKHLFQFAGVAALSAGMALAQAPASYTQQAPEKGPVTRPMFGHQKMMEALNLSPAQKQQAETIFGDAKQKAEPIRQEMRQNREALAAAVKANNTAQIERLSMQQGNLIGKTLAIKTQARAKFYATLTPEQRMKADQMFERMRSRRQGMTEER